MADTRADGVEHGITIKSTGISLFYEMTDESLASYKGEREVNECWINLIDSPGDVYFSSEVTAAVCINDDALVVVDCNEGVCVLTDTVLRQALGEKFRPILTVNKMGMCFLERQVEGEEAYQTFSLSSKMPMSSWQHMKMCSLVMPKYTRKRGTIAFSAGLHRWACTTLKRCSVLLCYEPIKQIQEICMNDQKDKLWPMRTRLAITMKNDDLSVFSVVLLREVLQLSWDLGGSKFFRFFIPAEEKGGRHATAPVYYSGHHNYYLGVFLEQVCILYYLNFVKVCVNYGASCNFVEVLQLKVPWDPGGSTRHRLEVKPKFKKGGMLATSPPATTGLGLGFLHWAWAARKTEAATTNINGMVTNKGAWIRTASASIASVSCSLCFGLLPPDSSARLLPVMAGSI
jgi:hypothetical protein